MAALPAALMVAVIAMNALAFMGDCAAFDRIARNAIRAAAASPAYGQSESDCADAVRSDLAASFSGENQQVSVSWSQESAGMVRYTATLSFTPTLFGRSFSGGVFEVFLVPLSHSASLAVSPYRPGVVA